MARKKNVSVFVTAIGLMQTFWTEFTQAIKDLGGSDEDIYVLFTAKGRKVIREMAQVALKAQRGATSGFQILVNYAQTLDQMIKTGEYDWVNSTITQKNFPIEGEGQVELIPELLHLGRDASTDEVLAGIDKQGYRPATLPELLAFGARYPDKQREFPIVALGSFWRNCDGHRFVAVLDVDGCGRCLSIGWCGCDWNEHCRFLVVRK